MRFPLHADSPIWLMRIFRPWLVATAAGAAMGYGMLNFSPEESGASYNEPAPRSAAYDSRTEFVPPDPALPSSGAIFTDAPRPVDLSSEESVPSVASTALPPAEPVR